MKLVKTLVAIIAALMIGFIVWITGASLPAIIAGTFLLLFAGALGAKMAGVVTLTPSVEKLLRYAAALCLVVIAWTVVSNWWEASKVQAKLDAKNMSNPALCKNDDSKWVKIPAGHYKHSDGSCVEGKPPTTTVVQDEKRPPELIKSCTSGESDCKITSGSGMTFTSSASRVIVKFTDPESGKKSEILFGDFVKDLAKFQKQTELVFDTTKGAQPDVVKIYQNY